VTEFGIQVELEGANYFFIDSGLNVLELK
jgi:hypothetical protein